MNLKLSKLNGFIYIDLNKKRMRKFKIRSHFTLFQNINVKQIRTVYTNSYTGSYVKTK